LFDDQLKLQFLEFESIGDDELHPTWEAMASVRPEHRASLEAELTALLSALSRWLGEPPRPLDDGGRWDLWLQAQWDGQTPVTLEPTPGGTGWAVWNTSPSGNWLTLTVTLAADASVTAELDRHLGL
jgi:hypothetical protein